jgi:hypothetical protein
MSATNVPRRMDVQHAAEDLRGRTLAGIRRPLDRLIYLASTRDYNTGIYHHDGLASRYSAEVACQALADCHRDSFHELMGCSLRDLVHQIEGYMCSAGIGSSEFITSWKKLEPYRVAVPVETEPLSAEFLFSNFKIALAILEARLNPTPAASAAWPRRSPGR